MRKFTTKNFIPLSVTFTIYLVHLLFWGAPLYGQRSAFVQHLTLKDGLIHNRIKSILKDHYGFLWVGTDMGLCRFDGYRFSEKGAILPDHSSLRQSKIAGLYEDDAGFIWIGTDNNGLYRYNQETETFLRIDYLIPDSLKLKEFSVNSIAGFKDKVYVATSNGVFLFSIDPALGNDYHPVGYVDQKLDSVFVSTIMVDHLGILWAGTQNDGLFSIDSRIDQPVRFNISENQHTGAGNYDISCLLETPNGNIVVGTWGHGFCILYRYSGIIRTFNKETTEILDSEFIYDLELDQAGIIWVGTYMGSLYNLNDFDDPGQHVTFQNMELGDEEKKYEGDNSSKVIYKDETGFLWIGTLGNGIIKFYPSIQNIDHIFKDDSKLKSLNNNDVTVICEDHLGGIWLGTWGGGLNYSSLDQNGYLKNQFIYFTQDPSNPGSISDDLIQCIFEDSKHYLWIGTYRSGLNRILIQHEPGRLNPQKVSFEHFHLPEIKRSDPNIESVSVVYESSSGEILIGTDRGLMKFMQDASNRNYFDPVPADVNLINGKYLNEVTILNLLEYPQDVLWMGTLANGLIKMVRDSSDFGWKFDHLYQQGDHEVTSLSSNCIRSLAADELGNLWIGTPNGLNKFQITTEIFLKFGIEDGMSNRNIGKIINDQEGNLWIGTELGFNRFNLETNSIKNYVLPGDVSKNDFNWGAGYQCKTGMICFGSNGGLVMFKPSKLTDNDLKPPVVFTNLMIGSRMINVGAMDTKGFNISKAINFLTHLELRYRNNTFSIEFSGLSYYLPELNRYKFKLEGYHQSWIYTDFNSHMARFYNIPPGHYKFKVAASNNDGIWNETGKELQIRILNPIWTSWIAYLFYFLVLVLLVYYVRKISRIRVKMKNEIEIERISKEKSEEVNQLKIKFFTSISHEFMTPLTLIIAPLEKLIQKTKEDTELSHQLIRISKNAKRLQYLINELMDFRKIETGKLSFNPGIFNINDVITEVYTFFENYAQDHHFQYTCSVPDHPTFLWIDSEKLEKILVNLLSNAFKFTENHGEVSICLCSDEDLGNDDSDYENTFTLGLPPAGKYVEITVKDTGLGIPEDKLHLIFERFYQIFDESTHSKQGTGIGLALVKEFVLIHNGQICVESTIGKGTLFRIRFPVPDVNEIEKMGDESHNPILESREMKRSRAILDIGSIIDIDNVNNKPELNIQNRTNKSSPLLLIVEDNLELRSALSEHFKEDFRVIEAGNGEEALKMTVQFSPNLVICDIIMPVMNGIQFCKELRENIHISHTPVILLTADTDMDHKIQGIETGADSYITKPFSFRFLDATVNNLLESRAKLRQLFSKKINVQPGEITVTSRDEKILMQAIKFVEENMANENLGVNDLCVALGFSRSQMYRKLKNLTSLGPNEFIRSIRLKVSAQLLIKEKSSVSEILYKVGFSNRSYFASCFKKEFGLSPKEYQEKYSTK